MDRIQLFKNLMTMAAVDGKFTDEEVEFLTLRSNRWGLSDAEFDEALRYARSSNATVEMPREEGERRQLLEELLRIMAADGELADVEKRLFAEAAAHMQIEQDELEAMIDGLL